MHFLTPKRARPVFVGLVAAAIAGTAPAAHAADHPAPVTGHVYVDDNTTGINTIGAFDRHADGSLTQAPGSPFIAGGAGTGSGLASQGALQLTPNGRFLIVVDAGSNQISVLRIRDDGSASPVPCEVVWSGGVDPVSVTVAGNLVYVANAGVGGTNFTGFRLTQSGRLRHIPGSTVDLPAGAQPGDVLFNPDGTKLAGTLVGSSEIDSFVVRRDGRLQPAPGSPFPAQGMGPFGSEFRPTVPDQLFVSNAHNTAPDSGTVSAYRDSANGTLTTIGSSPYPDLQMAPCWVEISHDGRFLFTVNTLSDSISSYSIGQGGTLALLGSTAVSRTTVVPVDARLSPNDRWLFVDEAKAGAVATFAVHSGTLTELPTSPTALAAGAAPAGIAVN